MMATPSKKHNNSSASSFRIIHNRARRDTIFSHFTNNSQSTTSSPDDEKTTKMTFSDASDTSMSHETNSNQPQFKVGESDNKKNSSTNTENITTTENSVVAIFFEIIQYGQNVTKALFGKMDDSNNSGNNNANPNWRNRSESSGADDDNNNEGLSHTTGSNTTFTLFPLFSSTFTSNQNSTTNLNQHPQNGSDSLVQPQQKQEK
jgi:hypothetical protein